jgi:hypothetical protein
MHQKRKPKRHSTRTTLRLPDLDYSKNSVLQSLKICGIQADLRSRYRRFHNVVLLRAASRVRTNRGAEI